MLIKFTHWNHNFSMNKEYLMNIYILLVETGKTDELRFLSIFNK